MDYHGKPVEQGQYLPATPWKWRCCRYCFCCCSSSSIAVKHRDAAPAEQHSNTLLSVSSRVRYSTTSGELAPSSTDLFIFSLVLFPLLTRTCLFLFFPRNRLVSAFSPLFLFLFLCVRVCAVEGACDLFLFQNYRFSLSFHSPASYIPLLENLERTQNLAKFEEVQTNLSWKARAIVSLSLLFSIYSFFLFFFSLLPVSFEEASR